MSCDDLQSAIGPALQVLLVLLGWGFIEHQRRVKYQAAQWSQLEREIMATVDEIMGATFEYYTTATAGVRVTARWRVRAKIEQLNHLCGQCKTEWSVELSDELISLQSAVGRGFDSQPPQIWEENSQDAVDVSHQVKVFKAAVAKGRPSEFRRKRK